MKKLDNGDKMIIASVILAIGIAIGAYFIANPKSELQQCMDTFLETHPYEPDYEAYFSCASMIKGK
jgi:hypothetical protein